MQVIQIVRESGQQLARRVRQLAEMAFHVRDSATPSAPAGGEPNAIEAQAKLAGSLAILDSLSFELPRETMKCLRCGGALRAVPVQGDYRIVCDSCEYFTYAGPYRQLIADLIGEARATLTRN